jgi:hypothetical protein
MWLSSIELISPNLLPLLLLPRRWVIDGSFAWMARFRRLARDYERLPETLAGLHFLAFAILMLARVIHVILQSA